MTQKRGLGRGLGALIPGGGQSSAPARPSGARAKEAAEEAAVAAATSDAEPRPSADREAADASQGRGASGVEETSPRGVGDAERAEAPLRTRSHPRTEPEPGEPGASRPVDMFFSGEPLGSGRSAARSDSGRDVAGAMARAAAERRAKTSAKSGAKKSDSGKPQKGAVKKPAAKGPVAKTSTGKSPAGKRSTETASGARTKTKRSTAASATQGPSGAPAEPSALTTGEVAGRDPAVAADTVTPAVSEAPAEVVASIPDEAIERSAVGMVSAGTVPMTETSMPTSSEPEDESRTEPELEMGAGSAGGADEDAALVPVPGAEFAEIPIHEIRENPRNPRTVFDDDALDELAYSLREVGVLQPVVVRPIPATDQGESFELVMGERRWRAARRAGLLSIPAIIRETSDDDLLRDALLENLHRSQLNPLEEAAAYSQLLDDFGCTQDELADRIGRSRPQISNTLRLMKLPPLVQRRLASGAISAGHARALLGVETPELMEELAQRVVAEGLSVRATERLVARGGEPATTRTAPRRSSYNPRVVDLTSRLSNRVEAPVRIDVGKRKGRVTLEFTNLEDLERLMDRLGIAQTDDVDGGADTEGDGASTEA